MTRLLATILLATASLAARATVLTFDIAGVGDGSLLPQSYGDNVTSFTSGTFSYGSGGGLTPDVTVDYLGSPGSQADLNFWTTGYSDLNNVVEYEPDGAPNFSIVFSAAVGQFVTLESFDLGNFGGEVTLAGLQIRNESNVVVFSQTDVVIPASSQPHLSFAPNVTGQSLTLFVDLAGLGGASDNIGLDNIRFSQSANPVPEPAAFAVLGLGFVSLVRRAKSGRGRQQQR